MLNVADVPASQPLGVIDYADPAVDYHMKHGGMNTTDGQILQNVQSSIRRGHPQMSEYPLQHNLYLQAQTSHVCLVGSGPSLNETVPELVALLRTGATLVTLNGAYLWCLERNLEPRTQIVMDARASNVRFVQPYIDRCNYVLASQCDPAVWDAVQNYRNVRIWHPVIKDAGGPVSQALDAYYGGQWMGIGGGTTVATRALHLLRKAGYVRFSLFGVDCCWLGGEHHALSQPENARDTNHEVRIAIRGAATERVFECAPWHLKQMDDFLITLRINGRHFMLDVHGEGMLAYAIQEFGKTDAAITEISTVVDGKDSTDGSTGVQAL